MHRRRCFVSRTCPDVRKGDQVRRYYSQADHGAPCRQGLDGRWLDNENSVGRFVCASELKLIWRE